MTIIETTSHKGKADWEQVLFPVEEKRVNTMKDGKACIEPEYKALCNSNTGETLSIVSNKYGVVDNIQTLNHFTTLLEKSGVEWEKGNAYMNKNGKKTVMELVFPGNSIIVNGDKMDFRGYIVNSFNGSSSVRLQLGNIRHVCKNMDIMIGEADLDFKTSHMGNTSERVNSHFEFFINEKFNETEKYLRALGNGKFQSKTEISEWIENDGNTIVADRYKPLVSDAWKRDENSLAWWYVYNAYTYVLTHMVKINMVGRMDAFMKLSKYFQNMMKGVEAYKSVSQ